MNNSDNMDMDECLNIEQTSLGRAVPSSGKARLASQPVLASPELKSFSAYFQLSINLLFELKHCIKLKVNQSTIFKIILQL